MIPPKTKSSSSTKSTVLTLDSESQDGFDHERLGGRRVNLGLADDGAASLRLRALVTVPPDAARPPGVQPGATLGEAYQVERLIGEGGMGVVLAARFIPTGKRVAIKILKPELRADPELMARFAREVRTLTRIESRYCVKVLDASHDPKHGPFMVMEYLAGHDLRHILQSGPLDVEQAVDWIIQVCDALASAHRQGIIHRDIKPENIFILQNDPMREVRVLDFGISKVSLAESLRNAPRLAATSSLLGSPLYMSPEQMRASGYVDLRTDVWSLGVTLFELISGVPPFHATSFPELCAEVLQGPPPNLSDVRPQLVSGLSAVVAKCLQHDLTYRISSMAELAMALAPFASSAGSVLAQKIATDAGYPSALLTATPPRKAISPPVASQIPHSKPSTLSAEVASPTDRRPAPLARRLLLVPATFVCLIIALASYRLVRARSDAHAVASENIQNSLNVRTLTPVTALATTDLLEASTALATAVPVVALKPDAAGLSPSVTAAPASAKLESIRPANSH